MLKVETKTVGHDDYSRQKPCHLAAGYLGSLLLELDTPRDLSSYVTKATTTRGCLEWAGAARRPPACCRTKQGFARKDAIFPQPPPRPGATATRPERDSANRRQMASNAWGTDASRAPRSHAAAAEDRDHQQHVPTPRGLRSGPTRAARAVFSSRGSKLRQVDTHAAPQCVTRLLCGAARGGEGERRKDE
ncbi:hypothetical protein INS49_007955 [Diaporthe citri]|uniref:uncharacterized protein n=1 Tax=Diaporthe citri TaxID=83186 RepID=UPI001C7FB004|nr:uncharacterized protein INS49_007955 [Diaporthe citri]KAG6362860.1 hypothetical protein INS49_007955 [Diaporthe citri]